MRVYITGVSGGIGRALALTFLERGYSVSGIGRHSTIVHPHYSFTACDLSDLRAVAEFCFETSENGCVLINNAGIIGPQKRISDQKSDDLLNVMNVNILAPMLLCRQFLVQVPAEFKTVIINISSGAANRPIPSWATYCASKIALDRFSETIQLEEKEKGRDIAVYSVAPGIVNTSMQAEIRSADPDHFSSLKLFQERYENNELLAPEEVAEKLMQLLTNPFDGRVVRNVNDL